MPLPFEELDVAATPIGEISLRRRTDRTTGRSVLEVRLGDEFLMSSMFTASEVALARHGLAAVDRPVLTGMVAGLGLGYTAHEVLRDARVVDLVVVELLAPVIGWHVDELVPDTVGLAADPRCRLVRDDFFDLVRSGRWTAPVDVLLVDIDHTPQHHLDDGHADFYSADGLRAAAAMLSDGGSFALWSDDSPDDAVVAVLGEVWSSAWAETVAFDNPVTGGTSSCTVYVARSPRR